jgi:hypothetical protein
MIVVFYVAKFQMNFTFCVHSVAEEVVGVHLFCSCCCWHLNCSYNVQETRAGNKSVEKIIIIRNKASYFNWNKQVHSFNKNIPMVNITYL